MARAALGVAGPRDLVGLKQSLGAVPRVRMVLEGLQAPLVASLVASLDDVPALRAAIEQHAGRRTRRAGARRRHDSRRRRSGARRPAPHQPIGQAGDRRDGRARARAHRHQLAESPVQPRVRLLHRDLEGEPPQRPGRLSPQADRGRRRALHHAGAEGVRGEGRWAPTSGSSSASSRSSRRCA